MENLVDVSGLQRTDQGIALLLLLSHVDALQVLVEENDVGLDIIDGRESELLNQLFSTRFSCNSQDARSSGPALLVRPASLMSAPLIFARNLSCDS